MGYEGDGSRVQQSIDLGQCAQNCEKGDTLELGRNWLQVGWLQVPCPTSPHCKPLLLLSRAFHTLNAGRVLEGFEEWAMKVPEEGGFPCYHQAGGFTAPTQSRQQQSLGCHYLAGVLFSASASKTDAEISYVHQWFQRFMAWTRLWFPGILPCHLLHYAGDGHGVWCAAEKFNVSQSSCLLRVYWSCDIPLQVLQHPKQQQQPCTISWLP